VGRPCCARAARRGFLQYVNYKGGISDLSPWLRWIFLLRRRKCAKNGGFIGFFAKTALLGENENQLQNPHFETFAINTSPQ